MNESKSPSVDKEEVLDAELYFDQNSKRYFRYRVESSEGIKGSVYFPKDLEQVPVKILMTRKD